jgi:hypothetical protein
MDPYLEGSLWMTVHTQLSVEFSRLLAPLIRPKYVALTNERYVLAVAEAPLAAPREHAVYPDIGVSELEGDGSGGGASVLTAAPLRVATVVPESILHLTVEIRDVMNRRLVTAIEVLSPTNKREGRLEYLEKRKRVLTSPAHLLEIDFLRLGHRVPTKEPLPETPYFVFLNRVESRPIMDVWPIRLNQPLPSVPVPLLPGDKDAMLDLQRALSQVYDAIGYDLAIDYARPPEVPLAGNDARWANERLKDYVRKS